MALPVLQRVLDLVGSQEGLDEPAQALQQAISGVLQSRGPQFRKFVHGTWLGHPLHPVLTDLPIGFWTAALFLDLLGGSDDDLGTASDTLVGLGLLSSAGTAATGIADWSYAEGRARRVGFVHALLNAGASSLYLLSLLRRLTGGRGAGRGLSLAGYGLMAASSYLGGELISRLQLGVDHASTQRPPDDYTAVLAESALPQGKLVKVDANGVPVLLVREDGRIYALVETCAHLGGPLSEGEIKDGSVVCPWHGSRFAFEDGAPLEGPTAFPQPCLDVQIRNGQIEVRRRTQVAGGG